LQGNKEYFMKAMFPGMMCVAKSCRSNEGREIIPGQDIEVHPSIRGPQGGKKYTHSECMARSNPNYHRKIERAEFELVTRQSKRHLAIQDARRRILEKKQSTAVVVRAMVRDHGMSEIEAKKLVKVVREVIPRIKTLQKKRKSKKQGLYSLRNPSTSAKLEAVARKYGKNSPGGKLALRIARELKG
jgi:hypothetical protein